MLDLALWQARFREYMMLRHWAPQTVRSYTYELARFFAFLVAEHVTSVTEVTPEVLEDYRRTVFYARYQGRPTSPTTQASRLAAVKAFCRFLAQAQYLLVDPSQRLDMPRGVRVLPRTLLSEGEVVRLLSASDTDTVLGLRNRAILELLYAAALRNGELRALDVTDVHLDKREVHVRLGKYRKARLLPMGREAAHWLGRYLQEARPVLLRQAGERALFLSAKHGRLSREPLIAMVAATADKAGLTRRVTPHGLRHACATHMLARGASLRHLQEFLGHVCLDTTQRYTHLELSNLRAVHQRFHPRERKDP